MSNLMRVYTDGGISTDTNVDKCATCPFNPFRDDEDENIYTLDDGENIHTSLKPQKNK